MPTYEYQCDACEHNFDEFQSFSEKPLKKCPKCGKPKLRRVFGTGAAVIFKGSGFYQTDYRSESYKQGAKAEESKSGGTKAEANGKATSSDTSGKTGASSANSAAKTPKSKD
jgi:putative FmdB family regulatory protein